MSESVLAWHFLPADRHTRREKGYPPPVLVEVGQTLSVEGNLTTAIEMAWLWP